MRRFLGLLLLSWVCLTVYAQSKTALTGQLFGKHSSQPIEYASVAVYSISPHKLITGTVTDSVGKFSITDVPYGKYEIKVSYVGCKDFITKPFDIQSGHRTVQLGEIRIDDDSQSLGEVVVTGKRSTYQQTVDKKIFNVGSDIASGSGVVSDLLQHVPSVQVDMEGGVSLRGNDNVLILINGKPSVLTKGANRGTVLQQIPASSIERIEVVTNPSAQFKPDGTSGIINLILKKEKAGGLNGNLLANVGNKGRYNGGLSLGWNSSHWGITGNYGFRKDRRDRTNLNNRTLIDETNGSKTFVNQLSNSRAPSTSHIGGLGIQWNPTEKDLLEVSGNYTYMKFPRIEDNHTIQWNEVRTVKDYTRSRIDHERQKEGEGSFSYTHTFSKGHELATDYTYALQDEVEDNHYTNLNTIPTQASTFDNTLIRQKNSSHLARLILTNQLNEQSILTTGLEAQLDRSDLNYYAEDLIDSHWAVNSEKTNHFVFDQYLYTAYATWKNSLDNLSWMIGVRGEYSDLKSDLRTSAQVVKNHNLMVFPTLHTSYKLNARQELQLNYSLRVNRPEGDDMNPFPEYQDPYNLKAGNPNLKPEKIHSVELGWQYKKEATTLILTPYYRYTFNKLTSITKVMADGVLMTTKENMSSSSAAGAELVFNSSLGRWCNYNLSSNMFYNAIDATDLGYSDKKGSIAWYVSLNSDFNIGRHLMFQLNTRYNSSVLTPQGKRGSTYIVNMGARYDIPRYHLAFTATVSDLFDSFKSVTYVDTPTIQQKLERRKAPRIFYIGVSYKFGTHGDSKKDKGLKYDESL